MHFSDVIGQANVKQRLVKSVKENRVSHALLFLGAEGAGGLAMAIAFAQYMVCEKIGSEQSVSGGAAALFSDLPSIELTDSCGTCPACNKMKKLVHPDVTFSYPVAPKGDVKKPRSVDFVAEWRKAILDNPYLNFNDWVSELEIENKQGIIAVEESADILHRLSLKSVEAPYRIVIIWLPEKMHASAANKLLKIIEEPPDQTFFFLVAENYEQIIPTILSRTQLVKLNKLSDDEITEALINRHSLNREAARKIAHRSGGNYREAINLVEQHEEERNLNQQFIEWMRACMMFNVPKHSAEAMTNLRKHIDDLSDVGRERQKLFLQNGLHILRECLMINYADRSMIRFEGEELELFKRFAPFVNQHNAEAFIEEFNKAHFHIERNGNFKILFTDLSFAAMRLLQTKA